MSQLKVNELTNINNNGEPNIELHQDGSTSIRNLQNLADNFAENVIINPEMMVNQKGEAVTGNNEFPVDRWRIDKNDHGAYSGNQDNDHPPGFGQSIQISCTTAKGTLAANSNFVLFQRVEGFNVQPFAKGQPEAKPFSVSFWFKTNKQGTYIVRLLDAVNTRSVSHAFNVTAGFEWVQYTHTFPADTSGDWPSTNTNALEFQLWLCAGSDFTGSPLQTTWGASNSSSNGATGQVNFFDSTNNRAFLTGVQVTPTEAPIEFQHKNIREYVSDCRRYFMRTTNRHVIWTGMTENGKLYSVSSVYPVQMRTTPQIENITSQAQQSFNMPELNVANSDSVTFVATATSTIDGNYYWVGYDANAEL